ncbi:MAG: hypothetical protein ABSH09_15725 [Bryobacteraceae bacterium]
MRRHKGFSTHRPVARSSRAERLVDNVVGLLGRNRLALRIHLPEVRLQRGDDLAPAFGR